MNSSLQELALDEARLRKLVKEQDSMITEVFQKAAIAMQGQGDKASIREEALKSWGRAVVPKIMQAANLQPQENATVQDPERAKLMNLIVQYLDVYGMVKAEADSHYRKS
jgi:hypothetical protein